MRTILIYVLLALLAIGCNCVEGEGPLDTKTYDLGDLRGVHLDGALDIRLKQGSPQTIKLTAQNNLLELVEIEMNKGILYASSSKCYNTQEAHYIEITTPRLESITLAGSGSIVGTGKFMVTELDIELDGAGDVSLEVDAAEVHAALNGAGDINLMGESKELDAVLNGAGDILTTDMITESVDATINGAGDIQVYAKEKLNGDINGSGSILYVGKPKVRKSVSGSGKIGPF